MKQFFWTIITACSAFFWFSDKPSDAVQLAGFTITDTFKELQIIRTDKLGKIERRSDSTEMQILVGNVLALQDGTYFSCDSAVFDRHRHILEAFGHVHINDGDSIHTYADYLRYHSDKRYAYLQKNVKLTDGKGVLTTNELEYDVALKLGIYKKGGKVVNGKSVLTSEEGYYYADIKDVYFKKNVKLVDPQYKLKADSLLYNVTTETARFITATEIIDSSKRQINTTNGFYNLKDGTAQFGSNPVIRDGPITVTGDKVAFDEKTGISQIEGNGVFVDTAQGISVLANQLFSNRNTGALLATKKPLLIIKQQKDSIFVAADTLFSGKLSDLGLYKDSTSTDTLKGLNVVKADTAASDTSNRNRYFEAYRNVRIFSDSVQAVCDSLFYAGTDSIFRLFRDPVAWSNKTQISGDTMYIYTKNRQPERVHVFNNGIAINETDVNFYNQLVGYTINAYFNAGAIDFIRAKGEAESIYYARDEDSAYIGTNKIKADLIELRFENKELSRIVIINQPEGVMTPMRQVNPDEMRLRGFKWLEARRPKTQFELYE